MRVWQMWAEGAWPQLPASIVTPRRKPPLKGSKASKVCVFHTLMMIERMRIADLAQGSKCKREDCISKNSTRLPS